jgi:hypothetical protein
MLANQQTIVKDFHDVPKIGVAICVVILVLGMFAVGYDQGQLAEALLGSMGIHPTQTQLMFLHEFNHDLRHAAGFPCH